MIIRHSTDRRVGPAADKPRRPTVSCAANGGPALALLTGPTLRQLPSESLQNPVWRIQTGRRDQ